MKNGIEKMRKQIDDIDESIIGLLAERFKVVKSIGKWKKKNGIKALDPKRWVKVLESRIKIGAKNRLSGKLIGKIYEAIHEEALKIEESIKL